MTVTRRYLDSTDGTIPPVEVALSADVQPMPRHWTRRDYRAAARSGQRLPFLIPNENLSYLQGWYATEELVRDLAEFTDAVRADEGVVVGPVTWKEVSRS